MAVALATGRRDRGFLLGAALPDLASMVGVRVDRSLLPGAIADGVACHLAADEAFHAHPRFRDGSAALRADLRGIGLATGPTRALSHAGWELLLDGTLVGGPAEDAYRSALDTGEDVTAALAPEHRRGWEQLLARRPPPPLRYDDPAWVTDRLFAMLSRRPRLRFDEAVKPSLAAVLRARQEDVAGCSATVLHDVAARSAAPVSLLEPEGDDLPGIQHELLLEGREGAAPQVDEPTGAAAHHHR